MTRGTLTAYMEDVARLTVERDEARAEVERLRAQVEAMHGTLADLANPDHWAQNDNGEWIWYVTYPPFERPAIDLLGRLGRHLAD